MDRGLLLSSLEKLRGPFNIICQTLHPNQHSIVSVIQPRISPEAEFKTPPPDFSVC